MLFSRTTYYVFILLRVLLQFYWESYITISYDPILNLKASIALIINNNLFFPQHGIRGPHFHHYVSTIAAIRPLPTPRHHPLPFLPTIPNFTQEKKKQKQNPLWAPSLCLWGIPYLATRSLPPIISSLLTTSYHHPLHLQSTYLLPIVVHSSTTASYLLLFLSLSTTTS